MRANWGESLPPAGIVDREELEARRYCGMNPAFVRSVWAKRRTEGYKAERRKRGGPSTWTEEDKMRVAEMMKAGLTTGQIGAKMGKTANSISGIVHSTPWLKAIGFQSVYAKPRSTEPAP